MHYFLRIKIMNNWTLEFWGWYVSVNQLNSGSTSKHILYPSVWSALSIFANYAFNFNIKTSCNIFCFTQRNIFWWIFKQLKRPATFMDAGKNINNLLSQMFLNIIGRFQAMRTLSFHLDLYIKFANFTSTEPLWTEHLTTNQLI